MSTAVPTTTTEHPNAELLRTTVEMVLRGELDAMLADYVAEDLVWHMPGRHVLAGDLFGHDGARRCFSTTVAAARGSIRIEPITFLGNDDHAVGFYRFSVEMEGHDRTWTRVNVYRIHDGRIAEIWTHESDQHLVDALLRNAPADALTG